MLLGTPKGISAPASRPARDSVLPSLWSTNSEKVQPAACAHGAQHPHTSGTGKVRAETQTIRANASGRLTGGMTWKEPVDPNDDAVRMERCLISCVLESPSLIAKVETDLGKDFLVGDHAKLWRAAVALHDKDIVPEVALLANTSGVDFAYITGLIDCGLAANFDVYVRRVQNAARERRFFRLQGELRGCDISDRFRILERMQELASPMDTGIQRFEDIPNIQMMDIPEPGYIVPSLGIARNTITLWTGPDGHGKTILAQSMAVAVAKGSQFLGMPCPQCPVLYVDLENPDYVVQARLRTILGEQTSSCPKVWGTWNHPQPPQSGSATLLTIAEKTKPLIVIDPFRYFHDADENDSTAMSAVMRYLRSCAAYGCAVIILHHPAKVDGSTGRGSTVIRAACDLAFLHKLDKGSDLITLKVDKNRHGERRDFTIKANFEDCSFELREAAWVQRRNDEMSYLQELIVKSPGISSSELCAAAGGRRDRILKLLEEGSGTLWHRTPGPRGSKVFFPLGTGSQFPSKEGELGNQSEAALLVPGTGGNRPEPGMFGITKRVKSALPQSAAEGVVGVGKKLGATLSR